MSNLSKWEHKHLGLPEINLSKLQFTEQIVGELDDVAATRLVSALPLHSVTALVSACQSRLDHEAQESPVVSTQSGEVSVEAAEAVATTTEELKA